MICMCLDCTTTLHTLHGLSLRVLFLHSTTSYNICHIQLRSTAFSPTIHAQTPPDLTTQSSDSPLALAKRDSIDSTILISCDRNKTKTRESTTGWKASQKSQNTANDREIKKNMFKNLRCPDVFLMYWSELTWDSASSYGRKMRCANNWAERASAPTCPGRARRHRHCIHVRKEENIKIDVEYDNNIMRIS